MLRKIEETIKSIAQLINQNVCKIVVIKNPSKITGNLKNEKTDIEEVKNQQRNKKQLKLNFRGWQIIQKGSNAKEKRNTNKGYLKYQVKVKLSNKIISRG